MIPAFSPLTGLAGMVRSLFSAGEPGVWYDPSDLSTLFQNAYGTTPVTAVGQPVGLMLDKSKGGPCKELVTNGTFDTNINGWTSNQGQIPLWSAGRLRLSTQNNSGTSVLQVVSCVIGKSYALNFSYMTVSGDGAGPGVRISTSGVDFGASGQIYRSPIESPTAFVNRTAVFTATQSTIYVYLIASGGSAITTTYEFDNISVRELPGNHATQATTTSRPTLQQDTSGKYYLSFDGVDDYLSTGSINFTATDKMTVLAGVRKLSDAAVGVIAEINDGSVGENKFVLLRSSSQSALSGASLPFSNYEGSVHGSLTQHASDYSSYLTTNAFTAPTTSVLSLSVDIALKSIASASLRVNALVPARQRGSFTGTSMSGDLPNAPLYIGRRGGTTYPFAGHLYGLIVRGAATDDLHLTHAEKFLAYKSGVTL